MKEIIKEKSSEVESIIYPFFTVKGGRDSQLKESMEYSLKAGGKRLRPMLMRETALLFGKEPAALPVFMAAIEMIHNYSLVHDDLPAMDDDMLRHGKPSTHAKFGESTAILCGDGLLNLAYEIVISYIQKNPEKEVLKAADILAKAAGSRGMVGGQSVDVMYDKSSEKPTMEDILYIYENKTGQLFKAPFTIGATLAKADESDINKLEKIGDNIGFAFQVEDDILDIKGSQKLLGKPVGSDEKNEKHTYLQAMGMEASQNKIKELTQEALDLLESLPGDKGFLRDLFVYLTRRDY